MEHLGQRHGVARSVLRHGALGAHVSHSGHHDALVCRGASRGYPRALVDSSVDRRAGGHGQIPGRLGRKPRRTPPDTVVCTCPRDVGQTRLEFGPRGHLGFLPRIGSVLRRAHRHRCGGFKPDHAASCGVPVGDAGVHPGLFRLWRRGGLRVARRLGTGFRPAGHGVTFRRDEPWPPRFTRRHLLRGLDGRFCPDFAIRPGRAARPVGSGRHLACPVDRSGGGGCGAGPVAPWRSGFDSGEASHVGPGHGRIA